MSKTDSVIERATRLLREEVISLQTGCGANVMAMRLEREGLLRSESDPDAETLRLWKACAEACKKWRAKFHDHMPGWAPVTEAIAVAADALLVHERAQSEPWRVREDNRNLCGYLVGPDGCERGPFTHAEARAVAAALNELHRKEAGR